MRLCSYVVKNDRGLAPNPFWGYCTLAVCTPNHMNIRAVNGDWFVGITNQARGNQLLFAMQVSEIKNFDDYYNDPRFVAKKPRMNGSWSQQVGDNMYFKDETGAWNQHETQYHCEQSKQEKDLKYPRVFIAEHFYYFGKNAVVIPAEHTALMWSGRGCRCTGDQVTVLSFLEWLGRNFEPGIHGEPFDKPSAIGTC